MRRGHANLLCIVPNFLYARRHLGYYRHGTYRIDFGAHHPPLLVCQSRPCLLQASSLLSLQISLCIVTELFPLGHLPPSSPRLQRLRRRRQSHLTCHPSRAAPAICASVPPLCLRAHTGRGGTRVAAACGSRRARRLGQPGAAALCTARLHEALADGVLQCTPLGWQGTLN